MGTARYDIHPQWDDPSAYGGEYPPDWDARRRTVYERDDWTCTNCGRKSGPHAGDDGVRLHAHHIVPHSAGGSNRLSNLTTLCEPCHAELHGHDLFETPQQSRRSSSAPHRNGPPLVPRLLAYLALLALGTVGGGFAYSWAIIQLLTMSMTWQTLIAGGVMGVIVVVGYHLPKVVAGSSLGAGLLFGGIQYYAIGYPLVKTGLVTGVLWLPAGIIIGGTLLKRSNPTMTKL
ncbi:MULTISPECIES: HNH endonuclease [Halobacteriales]|jgi:hypothetical protein|uniref:HNH endonuclease n=3 Tax=Halobacteriales TaxID=2235 RepID=A0AAW4PGI9_9EURY|nr:MULTISPECIES: HNH endonuclease [Halobacteria]MBX0296575.1 HNH endonuclease [Halomicroarcula nitratireducens]MDS0301263.1 HNH endonuclease [Halogeometricum sp. S1BR25-6]